MQDSINTYQARRRRWGRAAAIRLIGMASLLLPALCRAQTPPVYTISTIAGVQSTPGYQGNAGPATSAELHGPTGVALDAKGNLYIADQLNDVIREVTSGTINTIVGNATAGFAGDGGPATSAVISSPDSVFVDSKGNLYIADNRNYVIRMVTPAGVISTVAGSNSLGSGYGGDTGPATSAQLTSPAGITVDSSGNLYIADPANFRIRLVTAATGIISTYAGDGYQGYSNGGGVATAAHLSFPRGLALDAHGNLYFADWGNHQIRKVTPAGVISLVAGDVNGNSGYGGDGGPAVGALLDYPAGVAVDSGGNVYIADTDNNCIRMVTPDGIIHTIAGLPIAPGYSGDGGPALDALLDEPLALAVDAAGNLYVADYANNVIRLLTPNTAPVGPGPAPVISHMQSAGDFGALPALAPGSWIEIYGSNLAAAKQSWTLADFNGIEAPDLLGGTTVTVGGYSAFIDYVSPTQVNAQVPGPIALGPLAVTVGTAAGTSSAFTMTANLQEPGLWAPPEYRIVGQQYVAALLSDMTTYVFPSGSFAGIISRPAKPGETIVIYGVGFGPVPGNPPGQIAQLANGLTLPILPKFYFAGTQAQVTSAGLVSGSVGLYQFNVIVPPIAANNAVPLTFTINIDGTDVPGTQTLYTAVQP
jgi:uncharacterized protein (TIGR03437 family)